MNVRAVRDFGYLNLIQKIDKIDNKSYIIKVYKKCDISDALDISPPLRCIR